MLQDLSEFLPPPHHSRLLLSNACACTNRSPHRPFSIRDYVAGMRGTDVSKAVAQVGAASGCCSSNGSELETVDYQVYVAEHTVSSPQLQLFVELGEFECEERHDPDLQSIVVHGSQSLQAKSSCTLEGIRRRCGCDWSRHESGASECMANVCPSGGIVTDHLEGEFWDKHGSADAVSVVVPCSGPADSDELLLNSTNSSFRCRSPYYSDSNHIASACSALDVAKSRSQECSSERHGGADAYMQRWTAKTNGQHNRDSMNQLLLFAKSDQRKATANHRPRIRKSRSLTMKPGQNQSMPSSKDSTTIKPQCPVCMVFRSSSNTTLNAHMDHCLAVHVKLENSKPRPPRCKPRRKMKLLSELI